MVSAQTSCYLINTDSGTSRIRLAQAFPPDVTEVYAAVYEGNTLEENLLSYGKFLPGTAVTLDVPAGPSRIFVIWAKGTSGLATYTGSYGPLNLESGGTMKVQVPVSIISAATFTVTNDGLGNYSWSTVGGTTQYELQLWTTRPGPYETVYIGPETSYSNPVGTFGNPAKIRAISTIFGLSTAWF